MSKTPLTSLSLLLLSLNPYEFSTLGFIIGFILTNGLTNDQLSALGNFYELVGQTILTIQSQQLVSAPAVPDDTIDQSISMLKNKIGNIEQIIADFKNLS
ncbi:MAG: hypothetical protein K2G50_00315 [Anaeroplasmataceae bacterium]|nr:hypothetical protein [Anaeroplasmataceae bacterium]